MKTSALKINGHLFYCAKKADVWSQLSPARFDITWSGIMCPLPRPLQAQSTISLLGDGPEWRKPRRFYCCYIWTQMLDNVSEHLHLPPTSIFILWTTPVVSRLSDCYYLFRLINHKNRVKTSVCFLHMVVATVWNTYCSIIEDLIFNNNSLTHLPFVYNLTRCCSKSIQIALFMIWKIADSQRLSVIGC